MDFVGAHSRDHVLGGILRRRQAMTFTTMAQYASSMAGRPVTFLLAFMAVLGWALLGPVFHYSDTWQITVNTGTTIITFLMVFLIQATQNRDSIAIQAKLDELISSSSASNRFIGIDRLSEDELRRLRLRERKADV